MVDHLTTLLGRAGVVPAVNQIELHPCFQQREVQALNREHGILNQAWSPIGGITFYRDGSQVNRLEGCRPRRGQLDALAAASGIASSPLGGTVRTTTVR